MVERGIKKFWFSQAAVNFSDDDEFLYWARKSGCVMVLIGIEAETIVGLEGVRKKLNLRRGTDSYEAMFKKAHRYGIGITASLLFGLETDRMEDLYARGKFLLKSRLDSYQCTILTPLPGTVLYDRLKEQGRILLDNYPEDWQHYHFMTGTVNTPNMTADEINSSMNQVWPYIYSKFNMRRKMFRTLWNTKRFTTAYWAYGTNHNYGRMTCEGLHLQGGITSWVYSSTWKNIMQWLYLKITDKIIWLMYQLYWYKIIREHYGYHDGHGILKSGREDTSMKKN